jgi:hypothetical protein
MTIGLVVARPVALISPRTTFDVAATPAVPVPVAPALVGHPAAFAIPVVAMDRNHGVGEDPLDCGIQVAGRHWSGTCGAGGDYTGTQSGHQKQDS